MEKVKELHYANLEQVFDLIMKQSKLYHLHLD